MSTFDCSSEMEQFHDDDVRLPKSGQDEMRARRDAGRTRLYKGLERDGHEAPEIYSQGSYAMHTMVQDDDCDYDIDDGAYFWHEYLNDANDNPLRAKAARERVCNALTQDNRMAEPAKVHRNCVRQEYPTGYHIDVPVYRVAIVNSGEDDEQETYELASGDEWTRSDARAVTKWFKNSVQVLNGESDGGRQMRRVVRLTKAFARSHKNWKDKTCSGIVLTRLVVDEFVAATARDDVALRDTWKKIEARLKLSRVVEHPVNDNNLAEQGDECVGFFLGKLTNALDTLKVLDQGCTRSEARSVWDSVFNTSFFGKQPDPGSDDGTVGRSAFVNTESKVDRRDDGGGRYG